VSRRFCLASELIPGQVKIKVIRSQPVLHIILSVILGLVLIGALSAIFEMLALKEHPYLARILAAVCVIVVAYTHTVIRLIIAMAVAMVYVGVRRDLQLRSARKAQTQREGR
jgi:hypothetical protein